MNKKIPSYYNNFKRNEEIEDTMSIKQWLAAAGVALFGLNVLQNADAKRYYSDQLQPIVNRATDAQNEAAMQTAVDSVRDDLFKSTDLTEEQKLYIQMLEKKVAEKVENKKKEEGTKEKNAGSLFEDAIEYAVEQQQREIAEDVVGGLFETLFNVFLGE